MADTTFQQFIYTLTAGQGQDIPVAGSWVKAVAIEPVFDIEAGEPAGEFLLPKLSIEGSTKTDFRAGFTLFPDNPFTKIRLENPNTNQGMKITILIGTGDVRDDSVIFSRDSGAITVVQQRQAKRTVIGGVSVSGRLGSAEGLQNRNSFSFPAQQLSIPLTSIAAGNIIYDASFYGQAKIFGDNPNRDKLKLTAKRGHVLISHKKFELPYTDFANMGEYFELLECVFHDWLTRYFQEQAGDPVLGRQAIIRPIGNAIFANGDIAIFNGLRGDRDIDYMNVCDVVSTGGMVNGEPFVTIRNESGYSPAYSSINHAHPGILLNNGAYIKTGDVVFLRQGESLEIEHNGEIFAMSADNFRQFQPHATGIGGANIGYEETYYV